MAGFIHSAPRGTRAMRVGLSGVSNRTQRAILRPKAQELSKGSPHIDGRKQAHASKLLANRSHLRPFAGILHRAAKPAPLGAASDGGQAGYARRLVDAMMIVGVTAAAWKLNDASIPFILGATITGAVKPPAQQTLPLMQRLGELRLWFDFGFGWKVRTWQAIGDKRKAGGFNAAALAAYKKVYQAYREQLSRQSNSAFSGHFVSSYYKVLLEIANLYEGNGDHGNAASYLSETVAILSKFKESTEAERQIPNLETLLPKIGAKAYENYLQAARHFNQRGEASKRAHALVAATHHLGDFYLHTKGAYQPESNARANLLETAWNALKMIDNPTDIEKKLMSDIKAELQAARAPVRKTVDAAETILPLAFNGFLAFLLKKTRGVEETHHYLKFSPETQSYRLDLEPPSSDLPMTWHLSLSEGDLRKEPPKNHPSIAINYFSALNSKEIRVQNVRIRPINGLIYVHDGTKWNIIHQPSTQGTMWEGHGRSEDYLILAGPTMDEPTPAHIDEFRFNPKKHTLLRLRRLDDESGWKLMEYHGWKFKE